MSHWISSSTLGGKEAIVADYQFATIDEVINCTLSLKMPNLTREYLRWLISQDFNATRAMGIPWWRMGDYYTGSLPAPEYRTGYAQYSVERIANYGGYWNNEGFERQLVLTDGLSLIKANGREYVWYLGVDGCMESPFTPELRYRVRIEHYPAGNSYGTLTD